jgi:hypothetical protein
LFLIIKVDIHLYIRKAEKINRTDLKIGNKAVCYTEYVENDEKEEETGRQGNPGKKA